MFIKQSNRRQSLKIFKNSFQKGSPKEFAIFLFDSLITAVFYDVKISIFQYSFCGNAFIRSDTIGFRGAFTTTSNIYDRAFCKISNNVFSCLLFSQKTPF